MPRARSPAWPAATSTGAPGSKAPCWARQFSAAGSPAAGPRMSLATAAVLPARRTGVEVSRAVCLAGDGSTPRARHVHAGGELREAAMDDADYRYTVTDIDVAFDPHGLRAWLSCALDDGKMLLLATDRVTLAEMCRVIQQQLNR